MEMIWLALVLILLLIEIGTLGLVTIWFMCGALAAFLAAVFGGPVWLQLLLFFVISLATLAGLRPFAKKFINEKTERTNVDSIAGKIVRVTEPVNNTAGTGRAQVDGMEWMARSVRNEETFEIDERGIVLRVEGVKLILKKEIQTSDTFEIK